MIPTVEQVKAAALEWLDDRTAAVCDTTVQTRGFEAAYGKLIDCFLVHEINKLKKQVDYTLPAGTTSLTPATASIADFGELERMEERTNSSENYTEVWEVDKLPQSTQRDTLVTFTWRDDAWYFVGATVDRQLQITYWASGTAPSNGTIGIDNSKEVLAKLTAFYCAQIKDRDLRWLYSEAVGTRYDSDQIVGGDMFRLIQPMVRSKQRVPVAPRPFRFGRVRRRYSNALHVAANPVGTGTVVEFIISGTIDGTTGSDGNATFTLNFPPLAGTAFHLFKNGVRQTENTHFTRSATVITFLAPFIPVTTDSLSATGQI